MREELKKKIKQLKKEKNAVILAHYYQPEEVQEIADYVGDSYYLSKIAANCDEDIILFCGVKFMAESAKILAPEKKVLLGNMESLCGMVIFADEENVAAAKKEHPEAVVLSYINSSTEVKTVSYACCTSSSAEKIVRNIDADEIIFVPDQNLGSYIQEKVPDKKIILWPGYCCVHHYVTAEDVKTAIEKYGRENILIAAHPECKKEVRELADFVGSTGQIIEFCTKSEQDKFLILTEQGIEYELKKRNPEKTFHFIDMICYPMKKTTLEDIYSRLENEDNEIILDEKVIDKAMKALKNMHILSEM